MTGKVSMSHRLSLAAGLALVALHTQALVIGADSPLPVRNGRPLVATVNRDAISLDEFMLQLDAPGKRPRLQQGQATRDELALLDRLVTIKLIVQEATTMGLNEIPEIQKQV